MIAGNHDVKVRKGAPGSVWAVGTDLPRKWPRLTAALRACDLGVAMQLTNIARDVGEDARRGRVYLPSGLLSACGTSREAVLSAARATLPIREATRRLLALADDFYRSADRGIPLLTIEVLKGSDPRKVWEQLHPALIDAISWRGLASQPIGAPVPQTQQVEYDIGDGSGRSVLYAHAGKMLGGNTAFAHFGTYETVDGEIVAQLRTRRHSRSPQRRSLVSADSVNIHIRGKSQGDVWRFEGNVVEDAARFRAVMTRLGDEDIPPAGAVGEGGIVCGLSSGSGFAFAIAPSCSSQVMPESLFAAE